MLWYLFSGGAIVAVVGLATLFILQLRWVRRQGDALDHIVELPLGAFIQRQLDRLYWGFAFIFRQGTHYVSLYTLLAIRRGLIIFRYLLVRVERRFGRLIETVKGRQLLEQGNGPVSLFLAQIKDHKEQAVARFTAGE